MIRTVKQLLYITRTSTQLAEQMAEIVSDETWKQQFILYLEDITRQYKLWQYIHYLLAGAYEESDSEKIVTASVSELLYALCSNELKKECCVEKQVRCYRELHKKRQITHYSRPFNIASYFLR